MKNRALIAFSLGGVFLLAVLVSLCGIGLSLGIRKLSIFGFFSAIGLLVILRIAGGVLASGSSKGP